MHVKNSREVPEYEIDPSELDFTNSVDITKVNFPCFFHDYRFVLILFCFIFFFKVFCLCFSGNVSIDG